MCMIVKVVCESQVVASRQHSQSPPLLFTMVDLWRGVNTNRECKEA